MRLKMIRSGNQYAVWMESDKDGIPDADTGGFVTRIGPWKATKKEALAEAFAALSDLAVRVSEGGY